jgi:hypothetical protein
MLGNTPAMDIVNEITSQGRRALVDLLHGGAIEHSSPWSPDVPLELRHSMPDLFDRFPITWPWEHPKPVDPALHNAWILDNTAYRDPKQDGDVAGWKAEFVAAYFVKNSGKDVSRIVANIADYINLKPDDLETRKRVAKRLQPFIDAVLPNRTLEVSVDGKDTLTLGPSSQSGISSKVYDLESQYVHLSRVHQSRLHMLITSQSNKIRSPNISNIPPTSFWPSQHDHLRLPNRLGYHLRHR